MNTPSGLLSPYRRQILFGSVAVIFLAGCGGNLLGPQQAPQLYVLKPVLGPMEGPPVSFALNVGEPDATDSLDTTRIALFNPPARMDYYANASWPDRLPRLLQNALVQAFEKSGRIAAVAPDSAGLHSDYMLQTEIRDFNAVYDVPDTAPTVKIRIMAKLVRTQARQIVKTHEFSAESAADVNKLDNIVVAANQALSRVLKDMVEWALDTPPPDKSQTES